MTVIASDVAAWAAVVVAALTAGGIMIGIGRYVLTSPLVTRIEAFWHLLDKRLALLEEALLRLDTEVRELRAGHATLIQRQADIAERVGANRRHGDG